MRQVKNIFSLLTFSILITGCTTSVQKRIMVTDSLSSNSCNVFGCYSDIDEEVNKISLSKECMKISYYKSDLDALLDNGAKIISAVSTEKVVEYDWYAYQSDKKPRGKRIGECIGTEYIIEGYQSDFDKL